MKLEAFHYIWIIIERSGDVNTNQFFIETEFNIIPHDAVMKLEESDPGSTLERLKIKYE